MKLFLRFLFQLTLWVHITTSIVYAQMNKPGQSILRVYEDNDFLNIRGRGTDKAYSGGTRFDVFIEQQRKPFLIPKMVCGRRDSMVFIRQWGIMQMIFTPNQIDNTQFQPQDYFYSGALFLEYAAYAYNRTRRYSFQTALQFGVRGPAAMGKEVQTWVHRTISYTLPLGWDYQLKNMPLLNLNVNVEKQIAAVADWLEVMGGTTWRAGSLENGISLYPLLRIGKMNPYFNGYVDQYSMSGIKYGKKNSIQAYVVIRPEVRWVLTNALLQPNYFSRETNMKSILTDDSAIAINQSDQGDIIQHFVYDMSYGAVIVLKKFSLSYTQNISTEMRKNTYSHEVGNIRLVVVL